MLPLTAGSQLVQPDPVTRLVLIGAVAFWASRLVIQLAVFNRHARQSAAWLAISTVGTILWLYLTATWTAALIAALAGNPITTRIQPWRPPRPARLPA